MAKRKTVPRIISVLILTAFLLEGISAVSAFESTSASFEIHAGDTESTTGSSTSASFRLHNAGGQQATGISSGGTMTAQSGILYWLYGFFTSTYSQVHFRWRADAGCSESSTVVGCWPVNEDTQYITFPKNTFKRLRIEMANDGGWTRGGAPSFTLEVAPMVTTCAAGVYAAVPTTYGANAWVIATSTNVTDGAATTNVGTPPTTGLTDVGSTFVAGQTKTTGNTTGAISLPAGRFTEIEYALVATNNAVNGTTYCFRVTNNGSLANMSYTESKYAKAVLASGLPATGTLDSAVFDTFTTGSALQGPAYNSIMWKGSQNSSLGRVQFQLATSDSSSGPWTFYGSSGGTCNTANFYDTTGPGAPTEILCSPTQHNNQRYFRYRVRLCSESNCIDNGMASPIVDEVVVNWAP